MPFHSKIYNYIATDRKSSKSFGCDDFLTQDIYVGSSRVNSHLIGVIDVVRVDKGEYDLFVLSVDGKAIKHVEFNKKTKKFKEVVDCG
jgi:hypothetical protein